MIEIETLWALIDREVIKGARASCPPTEREHPAREGSASIPAREKGSEGFQLANRARASSPRESPRDLEGRAPFLSPIDLPPFNQSAVDGYAFADSRRGWHPITQNVAAGDAPQAALAPGQAARVFTGAMVPEGTLFVIKQEDCETNPHAVRRLTPLPPSAGTHIRPRGSVLRAGEPVFSAEIPRTAGAIALLASLGIETPPPQPALRALHIATGNELIPPGQPLPPGKIYDCNGPMIEALLREKQVACERLRLGDDPAALARAVGGSSADLVLVSGGSGPGDHDHTLVVLQAQGFTIHASRINSRPGKPLIFATRGTQVAFGLPGNPLSHFVCFHAFVARAIARLVGHEPPGLHPVELESPIRDPGDGRRTWTPARASLRDGRLVATPSDWAHSGDLRCLALANALLLDGSRALLLGPLP